LPGPCRQTRATLKELADWLNHIIRGWSNYYRRYTRSMFTRILQSINT